ncbi:MAG: hypothetical protein J0H54_02075 [Rhizobiales bacterium]|nr:hypothetical protein [Hyphomicrobiales bacterium]
MAKAIVIASSARALPARHDKAIAATAQEMVLMVSQMPAESVEKRPSISLKYHY